MHLENGIQEVHLMISGRCGYFHYSWTCGTMVVEKRRNSLHREKSLCLSDLWRPCPHTPNCQSHGHLTLTPLMFGAGIIKQNSPLNVQAAPFFLWSRCWSTCQKIVSTFGGRVSLNASSVGGHWPHHRIVKALLSWKDISFCTTQCEFKVVSPHTINHYSRNSSKEYRAFSPESPSLSTDCASPLLQDPLWIWQKIFEVLLGNSLCSLAAHQPLDAFPVRCLPRHRPACRQVSQVRSTQGTCRAYLS